MFVTQLWSLVQLIIALLCFLLSKWTIQGCVFCQEVCLVHGDEGPGLSSAICSALVRCPGRWHLIVRSTGGSPMARREGDVRGQACSLSDRSLLWEPAGVLQKLPSSPPRVTPWWPNYLPLEPTSYGSTTFQHCPTVNITSFGKHVETISEWHPIALFVPCWPGICPWLQGHCPIHSTPQHGCCSPGWVTLWFLIPFHSRKLTVPLVQHFHIHLIISDFLKFMLMFLFCLLYLTATIIWQYILLERMICLKSEDVDSQA